MPSMDWPVAAPTGGESATAFAECSDLDGVELVDLDVVDASHAEALVLDRPELVNVSLERCDIAGVLGRSGRASRIAVRQSRLRGVSWVNGMVQDATLEEVTGAEVSFRFTTLRRVIFRDCTLAGLDLTEAVLDKVLLQRCDLRAARFDRASVKALRIEGCDLGGSTGVESLSGASIDPDDLVALGPSMATALGLTVEQRLTVEERVQ